MVGNQLPQHFAVNFVIKNALDHNVQTGVQLVSGGQPNVVDGQVPGAVSHVQDLSAQLVLTDDRQPAWTSRSDRCCQRRFASGLTMIEDKIC